MRLLTGWCAGVIVHAGLVVRRATGQSRDAMRREAARLDDSAGVITVFALLAAAASLGSVAVLVVGGRIAGPGERYALALAGASLLCTWVFVQMIFTVHYAHVYYGTEDEAGAERGGLDFHGETEPDFWDFLYFHRDHRGGGGHLRHQSHQQAHAPDRHRADDRRLPVQHRHPGAGGQHGRGPCAALTPVEAGAARG